MMDLDPTRADKAEEIQARLALRRCRTPSELASVWQVNCEHFAGEARERMQDVYRHMLRKMWALHG